MGGRRWKVRDYQAMWLSGVKNPPAMQEMQETWVRALGQEDPLEEGMATHPSILAWKIPCREEPGRLQSIGSQRLGHNWSDWHTRMFPSLFLASSLHLCSFCCCFLNLSPCLPKLPSSPYFHRHDTYPRRRMRDKAGETPVMLQVWSKAQFWLERVRVGDSDLFLFPLFLLELPYTHLSRPEENKGKKHDNINMTNSSLQFFGMLLPFPKLNMQMQNSTIK